MRKALRVFIFLLTAFTSASAQDHLEPENSIFSEFSSRGGYYGFHKYHDDVLTVLREAFANGVVARAIVFPSFEPEFAVVIRKEDDRYTILHLEPEKQIWSSWHERYDDIGRLAPSPETKDSNERDTPSEINVRRCEMPIPNDLGEALTDLWVTMLRQTRFPNRRGIGLDGVTFHFSAEDIDGRQWLAGKIWTPRGDTATAKFAEITLELKDSCLSSDASRYSILLEKVDALSARAAMLDNPSP